MIFFWVISKEEERLMTHLIWKWAIIWQNRVKPEIMQFLHRTFVIEMQVKIDVIHSNMRFSATSIIVSEKVWTKGEKQNHGKNLVLRKFHEEKIAKEDNVEDQNVAKKSVKFENWSKLTSTRTHWTNPQIAATKIMARASLLSILNENIFRLTFSRKIQKKKTLGVKLNKLKSL